MEEIRTPYVVVDEGRLRANLEVLRQVEEQDAARQSDAPFEEE